ncbi:alkaline phosphatase family protein [Solimicrobium silvestre]|uniref:Phosphoesterase family n=1 Tax=Solimicrobium silvestre TaxID=2099400 RepID=A0A2S9GX62_9BURK|nr:alkaline phosphatase family protein [Solimicrobium silvestre]PRC92298.1 Phosphoesterase family [Solimicrobium silvestre]
MKLSPLALACSALVVLAGCHSGSSSVATPPSVNGIASAGAPLVGVVVTATDSSGNVIQSTPTDATGKFAIALGGSGPYVLTTPFNDADGSPALLSSVYVPSGVFAGSLQANINPLTSLITSRVLGAIPSAAPTGAQITTAAITPTTVANAELAITTLLQPIYTALAIPATETADPIGTTVYKANSSDPLDNLFTLAHFMVHSGQISIGTDANRAVINVPATGTLASSIPTTAVTSLVALNAGGTTTPITNVIVVIGENQTFDAVFGTYPAPQGQTVNNLLSEGIINADGTPGPNFNLALQNQGATQTTYSINPTRSVAYATLPQPLQIGELTSSLATLGGTPDPHFPANLANGPFQLTKYVPYAVTASNPIGVTTGDPVHRFFQMWQQTGGNNAKLDMFTWVADSVGQGGDTSGVTPANPSQGGELMAFLNMQAGDVPYLKSLAQSYALSDNYHQSILGGTGANFFAIATADSPYFNTAGAVAAPPANQIENPNPMAGTPNFYTQDGYSGGSYVNCSDSTQPGVAPILAALTAVNVPSNCDTGKYYLVNNYAPGYDMNGNVQPIGPKNYNYPPQTVPTIAEALANKGVSWKWYTGAREIADVTADATALGLPASAGVYALLQSAQYNAIGDPLVASQNVMTSTSLKAGLAGLTTFYNDVKNSTLPAVSFVVPKNLDSGHPGYSVEMKYELFLQNLVAQVKANPTLWAHTAIIITTDEGGGHFDTGAIQNMDFFGDGPRIPMLVVSPYARTNYIDHTYHDHASVLKFIERNWKLPPLSARSRDNHPIPVTTSANLYKPTNTTPAIGDLMSMFNF